MIWISKQVVETDIFKYTAFRFRCENRLHDRDCFSCNYEDCQFHDEKLMTKFYHNSFCLICQSPIDYRYFFIMEKFAEAGLMDKNYERLCCLCVVDDIGK